MWGRVRRTGKIPHSEGLSPPATSSLKSGAQARFHQFHILLFIHWVTIMNHVCILRFWMVHIDGEDFSYSTSSHIYEEIKSMHAVRRCYCTMHSDVLNHKTHAAQLRPASLPVFHSHLGNFNAAMLHTDYSQWPQWLYSSTTLASTWPLYYQNHKVINKSYWFAFCLLWHNLYI